MLPNGIIETKACTIRSAPGGSLARLEVILILVINEEKTTTTTRKWQFLLSLKIREVAIPEAHFGALVKN